MKPVRAAPNAACRAFEERLVEALGAEREPEEPTLPSDGHLATCVACSALRAQLDENRAVLGRLTEPSPPSDLAARLEALARKPAARTEALDVLALLSPGALAGPAPSLELVSRLVAIPGRENAAREAAAPPPNVVPFRRKLLTDWRYSVAFAYAAALLFVAFLRLDPLTVARETASDLSSKGESAISSARDAAAETLKARLEASGLVERVTPLRERLGYRVYRTVAVGKAKAVAYSGLVFERVFGSTETDPPAPRRGRPEPPAPSLRS